MYRIFLAFLIIFLFFKNSFAYPHYYSNFYNGFVILKGATDTIYGQILFEPLSYYANSNKRPYNKNGGYTIVNQFDSVTHISKSMLIKTTNILFARLYYNVAYPIPSNFQEVLSYNYNHIPNEKYFKGINIGQCYTDYKSFIYNGDTLLLRLLYSKKASVYDDFLNPEKNITDSYVLQYFLTPIYSSLFGRKKIFVYENEKLILIPGHGEFNFNFQRTHFVLKFINKRYGTVFKRGHFASNRQMFNYISEHG